MSTITKAFVYKGGEKIEVTVDSTFQGGSGVYANVTAVDGYPFDGSNIFAQGEFDPKAQHGNGNRNGLRIRLDFVYVESVKTRGGL